MNSHNQLANNNGDERLLQLKSKLLDDYSSSPFINEKVVIDVMNHIAATESHTLNNVDVFRQHIIRALNQINETSTNPPKSPNKSPNNPPKSPNKSPNNPPKSPHKPPTIHERSRALPTARRPSTIAKARAAVPAPLTHQQYASKSKEELIELINVRYGFLPHNHDTVKLIRTKYLNQAAKAGNGSVAMRDRAARLKQLRGDRDKLLASIEHDIVRLCKITATEQVFRKLVENDRRAEKEATQEATQLEEHRKQQLIGKAHDKVKRDEERKKKNEKKGRELLRNYEDEIEGVPSPSAFYNQLLEHDDGAQEEGAMKDD